MNQKACPIYYGAGFLLILTVKKTILLSIPVFAVLLYLAPLWNLRLPANEYPELVIPTNLEKRAMVAVAHDDDPCAMTGLVYKLIQDGWKVDFVTFYITAEDDKSHVDPSIRKKELQAYADELGINELHFNDFKMRKGNLDPIDGPYMPIPYAQFDEHFETDSLYSILSGYIQEIRPTIVLSLDDVFGGYGHPEHVLVSKTITDICRSEQMSTDFPIKYVYQVVISDLQELKIAHLPVYNEAKKVYMTDGVPNPTNELYVGDVTKQMMFGLHVWKSQRRNIRKFFPYFQFYPHWIYFKVVDREYYRVLEF
jgi:LmbE family N-acetylglucosaminyl deacetylase